MDEMLLKEPVSVKSALGENPKRVYGDQKKLPATRQGVAAVIRDAFMRAQDYRAQEGRRRAGGQAVRPRRHAGDPGPRAGRRAALVPSTTPGPTTSPPRCGWPTSSATAW
ncbi:hypothetical protein GCM10020220_107200 [Nonomuraea rubra]